MFINSDNLVRLVTDKERADMTFKIDNGLVNLKQPHNRIEISAREAYVMMVMIQESQDTLEEISKTI